MATQHAAKYWKSAGRLPQPGVPVFIVDDDVSYLYSLGFFLKKDMRCRIYCYSSGEECLRNLKLRPRIIVLDYFLNSNDPSAINGMDVLKKIRQLSPETKVIILSGQETLQVAAETLKSGAYTYLIKDVHAPFSIKNILETLLGDFPRQ